jgi:hypothetical protein
MPPAKISAVAAEQPPTRIANGPIKGSARGEHREPNAGGAQIHGPLMEAGNAVYSTTPTRVTISSRGKSAGQ